MMASRPEAVHSEYGLHTRFPSTSRWFAMLTPFWLFGIIFPPMLESEDKELIQFVSLAWLFVAGLFAGWFSFLPGPIYRERPVVGVWSALFISMMAASSLMSDEPIRSLAFVGAAVIGIACCAGLWLWLRKHIVLSLAVYGILGSTLISYRYFTASEDSTRLTLSAVTHANHLGLIALGVLMACLAIPNRLVAAMAIAANFMAVAAAQSRGAFVAGVLGLIVFFIMRGTVAWRRRPLWALVLLCGLVVLAFIIWKEPIEQAISTLMFLNDRYRGLGSGFTGRLEAWREAFGLFLDSPWFGVGFRMHERFMTTLPSAHSGYFSLLAETGLAGTTCILVVTALGLFRLTRGAYRGDFVATLGLGLVVGYLFLAAFERFFIPMGNPTSILAWMFLLMPERQPCSPPQSIANRANPGSYNFLSP